MCTVTFIPQNATNFTLTSNRDEAPGRETKMPQIYTEDGIKLMYPKDAVAGGTWIGVSDKNRIVTLMNGGFKPHKRQPYYRKSRGLVVKDLLETTDLKREIKNYNFDEIEPFTAVLVEWDNNLQLYQLVWDGAKYHFSEEPLAPQIWSSSPLYSQEMKKMRESWFSEFLFKTVNPTADEILQFHKSAGNDDLSTNLIIDRGFVKTKSITQISCKNNLVRMNYEDLQTGKSNVTFFTEE
ncbi:MAG: hypothetical protein CL526_01685 [Aequorivita sp.]|mgnify:CR=1 FL=1|nr:hypothetical protein [Aequorivita sp.]|tara:strand:+ start:752 stop:1465 length:714 start_codon:yes stop_codon:yes gene_type:complete